MPGTASMSSNVVRKLTNAGAQQERTSHDRIGKRNLTALLQTNQQLGIQLIQVRFDLLRTWREIGGT